MSSSTPINFSKKNPKALCALKSREFKIYKKDNYKIPSIGLIKSWKWKEKCSITPIFDGYKLNKKFNKSIDMKDIRKYIRDIIPMSPEENELTQLEGYFYEQQLNAVEWYPNVSNQDFFNSIFNQHVNVYLVINEDIDCLTVEEEFFDRKID